MKRAFLVQKKSIIMKSSEQVISKYKKAFCKYLFTRELIEVQHFREIRANIACKIHYKTN